MVEDLRRIQGVCVRQAGVLERRQDLMPVVDEVGRAAIPGVHQGAGLPELGIRQWGAVLLRNNADVTSLECDVIGHVPMSASLLNHKADVAALECQADRVLQALQRCRKLGDCIG